jgi:hypothetical protein
MKLDFDAIVAVARQRYTKKFTEHHNFASFPTEKADAHEYVRNVAAQLWPNENEMPEDPNALCDQLFEEIDRHLSVQE